MLILSLSLNNSWLINNNNWLFLGSTELFLLITWWQYLVLSGLNWWITTCSTSSPSGLRCCRPVSPTSAARASFCWELYFWSLFVTFRVTWKFVCSSAQNRRSPKASLVLWGLYHLTNQICVSLLYVTRNFSNCFISSDVCVAILFQYSYLSPFQDTSFCFVLECDSPGFIWVSTIRLGFFIAGFAISQMYEAESMVLQIPQSHQWLQLATIEWLYWSSNVLVLHFPQQETERTAVQTL